jgi:glycosyltransferase involved in cell wall biosynthesis
VYPRAVCNTLHPLAPGWHILSFALNSASVLLLVYWAIAIYRFAKTRRAVPTARAGLALAAAEPPKQSVCVIIPAHNEEVSIGRLLESLRGQDYPDLRVVLCMDRCTDRTAQIAQQHAAQDQRIHLLEIHDCPSDWAGKVSAIWRGVQTDWARSADLLLFADADTIFDPSCLRATVALLEHRRLDLLSLLSTLTLDRWFEKIVQPAAGMEMVRQYPIDRANRPPGTRRRPFANGQFMLFRREAYDRIGGHAAVKDELLEDIALARLMGESNWATGLMLADGLLRCRMYESWEQFRRGWKRIYTECAKLKSGRLRRSALVARVLGSILPALAICNLLLALIMQQTEHASRFQANLWLGSAGLLAWGLMMLLVYRANHAPFWAVPGSIIGSWLVADILSEAARELDAGIPVRWAGREYVRTPR